LKHEPVQYILGTTTFRHLELHVDRRVLIPRPETELLVSAVLDWSKSRAAGGAVLDIGTGSGAIALSLASEGEYDRIVASDASPDALDVARANAIRLGLADTIDFREGSLFAIVGDGESFDVIVSNPPYVAESARAALSADVIEHEPAVALFAGMDGLAVIDRIVAGAAVRLNAGGLLALEIAADQGAVVLERIGREGAYTGARVERDLTGRERLVLAETPA
jgi:release factor glutamine methyltransferase